MARIEDYALIGDLHTAALVSVGGSIDWLCVPRFDSPACFAALLGGPDAGRWLLAPSGLSATAARRYAERSLVLETEWSSSDGSVRVTDFMPRRRGNPTIVRIVEGLSGSVPMTSELRLRFDYGRIVPWVSGRPDGIDAVAGPDRVRLRTPVPTEGRGMSTVSEFTVARGDRVPFILTWSASHERSPQRIDPDAALLDTLGFWSDWLQRSHSLGRTENDDLTRSLITLKALTYEPTGGIVAAATTSLPEEIGGSRNWDYRYCWLRDSAYTLQALLAAGFVTEAKAWREWLLRAVAGDPSQLQVLYGVDGARRLPELELGWLAGYESSRPVRIGNAAADQLQLDIWGETLDCLGLAREERIGRHDDAWDLQVALMEFLESNWMQPDNGIWEMRGDRQHFTYSKVMAWVAADRMARGVRDFGLPGPATRWQELRDTIHRDVMTNGFDNRRNTFVQSYGSTALDASLLRIPRVGFLSADDPRVVGTIDAIEAELTEDGLVRRYLTNQTDDGVPGDEGVFLACSFWLVDALHGAGRAKRAREMFERLLELRNDVGLFSEEWDPASRRQLGNTPQALSHLSHVASALQLARRNPPPTHKSAGTLVADG